MIPDDVRKLLGGYATGTLSDDERNLLFSAALEHQELFDALADEEALRELLAEPATRQILLERLQQTATLAPVAMPRMWGLFTLQRLAVAGVLALLLIAAGLQYRRLHVPEPTTVASVDLLKSRPEEPVVREEPAPRPIPKIAPPVQSTAPVSDARVPKALELDRSGERKDENGAADATLARQQLNQAVRDQVERQQVPQAAPAGKIAERRSTPVSPSQIVTGGLSRAPAPLLPPAPAAGLFSNQIREIDAKVTDINGTIVSINAGSNAGLRAGDVVEIVRENRVIATSKLSQVGAAFAVGSFQRTTGSADVPQAGDTVRRAAPAQPQR